MPKYCQVCFLSSNPIEEVRYKAEAMPKVIGECSKCKTIKPCVDLEENYLKSVAIVDVAVGRSMGSLILHLGLVKYGDSVALCVVDETGKVADKGHLLMFDSNKEISRFPSVNPSFGFKLDKDNKLVID